MVPRFPLKSGRYTLDIACGLKSSLFDRVHDAYQLEVVRGDFFASGRLPDSRQTGSVLVDQVWSIKRLEVLE
jgi:hypothetical protein